MTQPTAFFDFDGTVIDGYSAKAVLSHRVKKLDLGLGETLSLLAAIVRTAAGQDVVEEVLRDGVKRLAGRPQSELDAFGRELTRSVIGGWLFPEAEELIADHQRQGHRVVIASSALPFQVEGLAAELGVDAVLCTQLEVEDGLFTGELDGDVLWNEGKAKAVRDYAEREGIDLRECYGYGNGDEDEAFLRLIGNPRAVNPGPGLAIVAAENDWPVLSFPSVPSAGVVGAARTLAAFGGLATGMGVGAALGLLNRNRRQAANIAFAVGSDLGLALGGVEVNVTGGENLWVERPAVFIFNHQSLLDGWAAINLVRSDFTGLGKKEMAKIPVMAQLAWLTNVALIDRADSTKARAALEPVLERLRDGYSIALAPEGTRSVTRRVGPFKKGAFHMAMQAGVPIVPMVIRNGGELQWRGSRFMRSGTLDVAVLPPISVADWTVADLDDKVAGVRQLFIDTLADWPGQLSRAQL